MMILLFILVIATCIISMVRLALLSVAGDILLIKQKYSYRNRKFSKYTPKISVLIPAYNEEVAIIRTIESVRACNYPESKLEIIVINDGSVDRTKEVVQQYKKQNKNGFKIRLINRPNGGKAHALNYALRNCAKGSLVMCLDADTTIHKEALRRTLKYFQDKDTIAISCLAEVIEDGSILALCQRIEYMIGFRAKAGYTQLNANYVLSGAGSVFRRSILKQVNYYESNTQTEDLDLTVKIIAQKNKHQRIGYAPDVIVYTEAVHTMKALMGQRYRWIYGRAQVFVKYRELFFSDNPIHDKSVTWVSMPVTILQDLLFLISPITTLTLFYIAFVYAGTSMISSGIVALTAYLISMICSVEHLSWRERLRLSYYAPPMYILIYLTSLADYYGLVRSIIFLPRAKRSLREKRVTWRSPERIIKHA